MKILAMETATPIGGVALMDDERLLAEYQMDMTMAHAERLMVMVDQVLKDCGLVFRDLDALAVSIGPGSFTGLRVAVNSVKGLVMGNPIPVAAVPTLEALAWNLPVPGHLICPMMDAKKQEVYAALFSYQGTGRLKRLMKDQAILPQALSEHVTQHFREPIVFLGDGAYKYRDVLEALPADRAVVASPLLSQPRPSSVAWLGLQRLRRGQSADARTLVPVYIRRPDAEVNWRKRIPPKAFTLKRGAGGPLWR